MSQGTGGDPPVVRRRRRRVDLVNPKELVKQRGVELQASGMPYQMAMAVAHGRISLNEALERMERLQRVNKMIEEHELSRALATQIALGQASLSTVLSKRRLAAHRKEFRDRSCLSIAADSGESIVLALAGGRRATAVVTSVDLYAFTILEDGKDEPEEIHKLKLQYAYAPTAWKKVRKGLKKDKAVASQALAPELRPQDRYTCSDKRLFRHMDRELPIQALLLQGDQVRGVISWFSRYEFGVRIQGEEVTVFRHALQDLSAQ